MTEGATKLLRELALLLRRHPPEDFDELVRLLKRPGFASGLARILAELSSAARQAQPRHRPSGRSDILETVRASDEVKYALLKVAEEKLFDRGLHDRLADLVKAIESSGVPIPKKPYRRREDVVLAFIQSARGMSTDDLRGALARLGVAKANSDLRSWSNIIVPKKDLPGSG